MRDGRDQPSDAERRSRYLRLGAIAAVVLVVILVVLDNRRSVRVGWVLGDTEASLIVVILLAFVAGIVVGYLGAWQRRRR